MPSCRLYDLFTESPYAAALSSKHLRSYCSNCFSPAKNGCGKCCAVVYCGKQCQMEDWPWHKAECNAFVQRRQGSSQTTSAPKDDQEAESEEFARLLGRVLVRKKKDKGAAELSEGFPSFAKNRCLDDLMSHVGEFDRSLDDLLEHFQRFFNGQSLGSMDKEVLRVTLCRIMINDFCISSSPSVHGASSSLGVGLYLNASRFDHTCERNARIVGDFVGAKLRLRYFTYATENEELLPKTETDFNNLTMCYGFGNYFWTAVPLVNQRRDMLLTSYFFECHCPRCDDQLDAILSWDCSSRQCPSCRKPYILGNAEPGRLLTLCRCSKEKDALPVPTESDNGEMNTCGENVSCLPAQDLTPVSLGNRFSSLQLSAPLDAPLFKDETVNVSNNWRDDPIAIEQCQYIENEWSGIMDACIETKSAQDAVRIGEPFRRIAAKYWHPVYNLRYTQLNEALFAAYRSLTLGRHKECWIFADPRTPMMTFRYDITDQSAGENAENAIKMALKIGEHIHRSYEYNLPPYDNLGAGHCLRVGELFELASILISDCSMYHEMAVLYYSRALDKWILRDFDTDEPCKEELRYRIDRVLCRSTMFIRSPVESEDSESGIKESEKKEKDEKGPLGESGDKMEHKERMMDDAAGKEPGQGIVDQATENEARQGIVDEATGKETGQGTVDEATAGHEGEKEIPGEREAKEGVEKGVKHGNTGVQTKRKKEKLD